MKKFKKIKNKVLIVDKNDTIDSVFREMALPSKTSVKLKGVAFITKEQKLLGIVTDGDIRRAYGSNINFNSKISQIMNKKYIYYSLEKERLSNVYNLENLNYNFYPILDSKKNLVDIVRREELILKDNYEVTVFGLGFVGLTLAASLSEIGFNVTGLDNNVNVTNSIKQNKPEIFEPGLKEILNQCLNKNLFISNKVVNKKSNVYIICVGTPISKDKSPDLRSILEVLSSLVNFLKKGDTIFLRSTLPTGTSRKIIAPYIEKNTSLKIGKDIFLAFTPERTVEGNAISELSSLPQIVGGFSKNCTEKARSFWSNLSKAIIEVDGIEAAEMVKLINNTFRDVSFAFANEVALKCDEYNIDSFDLISAANKGYPRNKISLPSPGVGGYCLTKDPVLFYQNSKKNFFSLAKTGRLINEKMINYPLKHIKRFTSSKKIKTKDLKVLFLGIAFKGIPETNDLRGSTAIDLYNKLISKVAKIDFYDFVIKESFKDFKRVEIDKSIRNNYDCIFILNNHPSNKDVLKELLSFTNPVLFFDGWNLIDKKIATKNDNIVYSSLGYISE